MKTARATLPIAGLMLLVLLLSHRLGHTEELIGPPLPTDQRRACQKDDDCRFEYSVCGTCPACKLAWRKVTNRSTFEADQASRPRRGVKCGPCQICRPIPVDLRLGTQPVCRKRQCTILHYAAPFHRKVPWIRRIPCHRKCMHRAAPKPRYRRAVSNLCDAACYNQYFDRLRLRCSRNPKTADCCDDALREMLHEGYQLARSQCPRGYRKKRRLCRGSLKWCQPR